MQFSKELSEIIVINNQTETSGQVMKKQDLKRDMQWKYSLHCSTSTVTKEIQI